MNSTARNSLLVLLICFLVSCETELVDNFCPGLKNCVPGGASESSVIYTTLYSDNFNRADEDPIAAPWNFILQGADRIEIKSNVVTPQETDANNPPGALHTTNVTATNVRVSVSVAITGAGYNGEMLVYMRSQSNGDILNTYFCGVDPTNNRISIGKTNAGTSSGVASSTATMTYNNGDNYTLTFTGEGTSLTCALTGSATLSVTGTDSDFSTGYAGLAGGENANNVIQFDNFLVETGN